MGVKQAIILESQSVTDQPVEIPFEFKNVPEGKEVRDNIVVRPITVRTWFQLKPYFLHIEKEDIDLLIASKDSNSLSAEALRVIEKYDELLFEMICIGLHNKPGNMPEWFKEVLKDSCTWEDMYILWNAIIFRVGAMSFINTITAAKAVSPLDEKEIIAFQENKDSWLKVASPS